MSKRKPRIRGEVETVELRKLKPNGWNPNRVPPHIMDSIRHGLRADGWIASHALLVWGSDEEGARQDIIIDGEHRWLCAIDVGMLEGPAVRLEQLSERDAKALTVKLNQKRGEWDEPALAALLQDLELSDVSLGALDLGFEPDQLASMLDVEIDDKAGSGLGGDDGEVEHEYTVVIRCDDEPHQKAVLDHCMGRGWKCRALI